MLIITYAEYPHFVWRFKWKAHGIYVHGAIIVIFFPEAQSLIIKWGKSPKVEITAGNELHRAIKISR